MIVAGQACTRLSLSDFSTRKISSSAASQQRNSIPIDRFNNNTGMHYFLLTLVSALSRFAEWRGVKVWLPLGLCAALAGCAGTGENSSGFASYGLFGPMSGGTSWQDTVDPISEYLARQQSAGIKINPDDIDHPLAKQMLTQLGIRYRFGGKSPSTGFDCSGLVFYSAQESLGLKLPPRSDDMAKLGANIERSDLKVGDLVFFNTMGRQYSHVGVYLGDSKFVHSPASGGVVRVEDMTQRYWDKRFTGARRLDGIEVASIGPTSDTPGPVRLSQPPPSSAKTAPSRITTTKPNPTAKPTPATDTNKSATNKATTKSGDTGKAVTSKSTEGSTNKTTASEVNKTQASVSKTTTGNAAVVVTASKPAQVTQSPSKTAVTKPDNTKKVQSNSSDKIKGATAAD
jgi:cell wall-associated NlpC family hydrolase